LQLILHVLLGGVEQCDFGAERVAEIVGGVKGFPRFAFRTEARRFSERSVLGVEFFLSRLYAAIVLEILGLPDMLGKGFQAALVLFRPVARVVKVGANFAS
jgi:hypothetical protein